MAWTHSRMSSTAAFILSCVSFGTAKAQPAVSCGDVLGAKTVNIKMLSRQAQLAWMRLVNQSNYESFKQAGSASVPGYFDGDYNSFNEKRNKLFEKETYQSSEFEAQQELSIEVPPDVISAWQTCMVANSTGLFVYAKNVDEDGATLSVNWKPSPGLSELQGVSVALHGAAKGDLQKQKKIDIGERFFSILRENKNQVVRGTISGKPGTYGVYSAEIYIPQKLKPPVVPPTPPPPPAPVKLNPLYVGQTPGCNAAIVTNHQNHLSCVNIPLGYTVSTSNSSQQLLYLGVEPFKNAGVVTTKITFHGGQTQEYGWTIRDDSKLPNSQPLFAVVGCGVNDGEVTTNPHHKNCTTVPIGWAYPW